MKPLPPRLRLAVLTGGVILIGLATTLAAFFSMREAERGRDTAEFERAAQHVAHVVREGVQRHQDTLYALRNLFHFAPEVSRETFAAAARDLASRQTGLTALEWIERVPGERRAAFEERMRAAGFAHFEITERATHRTLRRAAQRPDHFPVTYIEPSPGNELALGFDLASGITWPVLQRIAGTGELAASGRLPLITGTLGSNWGYIMELPVYAPPLTFASEAERRARLRGYVMGIFDLANMLEAFLRNSGEDRLEVLFLDRSARAASQFLHYHAGSSRLARAEPPEVREFEAGRHVRYAFDQAGRQWELWFRPQSGQLFLGSRTRSWLTLALGLVVTGFAASSVFGGVRREEVVNRLVAERTAELSRTQQALEEDIRQRREAERQLSNVISQLPGAAFRCEFDERLTAHFASDGMFQLTGYAADDFMSGRINIADLIVPEDRSHAHAVVTAATQKREAFELEHRIRDREGKERFLLVRGRPIYDHDAQLRFIEGLAIDVTALKAAELEKIAFERQLQETQKLESLGVLAGGIAHDFNNLLTAMLGNATLARLSLSAPTRASEHIGNIEQAARRAADLCQQMLAYAGKKEIRARPADLSELVRSTASLLRVSIRKNTRLDLRLAEKLPAVLADPAQLQQIVMNLVINAAEAIGEDDGEIVVTTYQQEADTAFLRRALRSPELPAGSYVGLEVRDSGCGMSPETLARIFEPFFTTKFSGRGLGLAAVLGIVQGHRGALFVESAPGRGSTFRLLLMAHSGALPETSGAAPASLPGGLRGTALVVDDEEAVRDVLAAVLRRHGMTPVLAASGNEALRRYGELRNSVDLVLLDLVMPGLSGEETLRSLRKVNRTQRVIVMSGFSEGESMTRCAELGVTEFIAKPFELQTLLAKLKPVS